MIIFAGWNQEPGLEEGLFFTFSLVLLLRSCVVFDTITRIPISSNLATTSLLNGIVNIATKAEELRIRRESIARALRLASPKLKQEAFKQQLKVLGQQRNPMKWLHVHSSLPLSQKQVLRQNWKQAGSRCYIYKGPNSIALTRAQSVLDLSSGRKQRKKRETFYCYEGYGIEQSNRIEKERKIKIQVREGYRNKRHLYPKDQSVGEYLLDYGISDSEGKEGEFDDEESASSNTEQSNETSDDSNAGDDAEMIDESDSIGTSHEDAESYSAIRSSDSRVDEDSSTRSPAPATSTPASESRGDKLLRLHGLIAANGTHYNDLKLDMLLKIAEGRDIIIDDSKVG